jgi:hypothetical protein
VRGSAAGPRDDPERDGLAVEKSMNVTVQAGAATEEASGEPMLAGRCSRVFRQGKGSLIIALGTIAQLAHRQPARKSA